MVNHYLPPKSIVFGLFFTFVVDKLSLFLFLLLFSSLCEYIYLYFGGYLEQKLDCWALAEVSAL